MTELTSELMDELRQQSTVELIEMKRCANCRHVSPLMDRSASALCGLLMVTIPNEKRACCEGWQEAFPPRRAQLMKVPSEKGETT